MLGGVRACRAVWAAGVATGVALVGKVASVAGSPAAQSGVAVASAVTFTATASGVATVAIAFAFTADAAAAVSGVTEANAVKLPTPSAAHSK